jgi:hypothetical protein
MKILAITTVDNFEHIVIFGLGDDNIIYVWMEKEGKWVIYKTYERN